MMKITDHFALVEFACHDGTLYPPEWIDERLRPLCAVLEEIRTACGDRPLSILSGYRSEAHNLRLRMDSPGVAKLSQHVQGRAADITVQGMRAGAVWSIVNQLVKKGELPLVGGLGVYPSWTHVDVRLERKAGAIARWQGEGLGSEPVG